MSLHLALFFTYGVSLETWMTTGMFHREVALYQKMQELGVRISFITYGTNDRRYNQDLPHIEIYDNQFKLPNSIYARLIPLLHMKVLRTADVIKTNQFKGGEFAQLAAKIWNKPLIARAGYNWSEFVREEEKQNTKIQNIVQKKQDNLIRQSSLIVVTTKRDATLISPNDSDIPIRIHPNYVLTNSFKPLSSQKQFDIVFLGRITPQKNIAMLLDALRRLENRTILLIGKGEMIESLQQDYADLADRVTWYGTAPHEDLPQIMQQARIYILPSHHEGHPKALIEAMSCGMPVVGTDVPGIQDVIQHGKTGWLCEKTPNSIAQALEKLLQDEHLQNTLGENARQYALAHYSLDHIAQLEIDAMKIVTNTP